MLRLFLTIAILFATADVVAANDVVSVGVGGGTAVQRQAAIEAAARRLHTSRSLNDDFARVRRSLLAACGLGL
jgi:hypothetical protein